MKNKLDETKFYSEMPREPCPFHGFKILYEPDDEKNKGKRVMKDGEGVSCALAQIINEPCISHCVRNESYWTTCPLNTKENGEKIERNSDKIMVFPKEFLPADESWPGIPLRNWMDLYIKYC